MPEVREMEIQGVRIFERRISLPREIIGVTAGEEGVLF